MHALRYLLVLVVAAVGALTGVSRAALSWSAPVSADDGAQVPMNAVACVSPSQCTAVDSAGREVTFDPGSPRDWSAYTIDAGHELLGVSCPYVSRCTGVDSDGQETTFNPGTPLSVTHYPIDPGHTPQAVACPTVSQCTATDNAGRVVTFNPARPAAAVVTALTTTTVAPGGLPAIACPATSQCTVSALGLGIGDSHLITFDPHAPSSSHAVAVGVELNALACPSLGRCVGVGWSACPPTCGGNEGATVTFDPSSSSNPPVALRSPYMYLSVACPSGSVCTTLDLSGQEVSFDPGSSSITNQALVDKVGDWPKGRNGGEIACPSTKVCAVVAQTFGGAEITFDPAAPNQPAAVPIDDGAPTVAVSCPTSLECVALAQRLPSDFAPYTTSGGVAAVFDPSRHENLTGHFISAGGASGLACPSASQCTVIGAGYGVHRGREVTFNPRRHHLRAPATFGPKIDRVNLTAVSCPTAERCTAVDVRGRQVTFDPHRARHRVQERIDTAGLTAVVCVSLEQCTAVDARGREVTFDPTRGSPPRINRIDQGAALTSLSCPSASQCTTVERGGREVTFNPRSGRRLSARRIDSSPLSSISCVSRATCVAVDLAGNAVEGNPRVAHGWTITPLPGADPLLTVFCRSRTRCVAADQTGHLFVAQRLTGIAAA